MRDGKPTALGRLRSAREYLLHVERYPDGTLDRMVSDHLLSILRPDLEAKEHADIKKACKAFLRVEGGVDYYARRVVDELEARLLGLKHADPDRTQGVSAGVSAGGLPAAKHVSAAPPAPAPIETVAVDPDAIRRAARKGQKRRGRERRGMFLVRAPCSWSSATAMLKHPLALSVMMIGVLLGLSGVRLASYE